ncbi:hypothetical protein Glove_276g97 [Diversispora epigaea]|uniref:Uncharacterized protein n=1 Tax=Diversispora epigaea TaxID=1348612 RepID=A0A397I6S6_9GLOM|nr:hypothetical protein Glove_276g97 [Diversispora epigaea]
MDQSISKNPGVFSESDRNGKLHQVLHMTINEMYDKALRPMKDGTLKSFFNNPHDYLTTSQYFLSASSYALPKLPDFLKNEAYMKRQDCFGCDQVTKYLNNIMLVMASLMEEKSKNWVSLYREFFYQALIATSKAKTIQQLLGFRYNDQQLEIYADHLKNTIDSLESITFVLTQLYVDGFVDNKKRNLKDLKDSDYKNLYCNYEQSQDWAADIHKLQGAYEMTLDLIQVGDFVMIYGCILYHFIGRMASYDFKFNPGEDNLDIISKPFQTTKRRIEDDIKAHGIRSKDKKFTDIKNKLTDKRKTIRKLYDCRDFHFVKVHSTWLDNPPKTYNDWMKNERKYSPPSNWQPPDIQEYRNQLRKAHVPQDKTKGVEIIDRTYIYSHSENPKAPSLLEYLHNSDITMNDDIMNILVANNYKYTSTPTSPPRNELYSQLTTEAKNFLKDPKSNTSQYVNSQLKKK